MVGYSLYGWVNVGYLDFCVCNVLFWSFDFAFITLDFVYLRDYFEFCVGLLVGIVVS